MSFTRVGKCKSGVPAEECILSKSIYARAVLVKGKQTLSLMLMIVKIATFSSV